MQTACLFGDCMWALDYLWCDPWQGPPLRGDVADVRLPLLLGEAKVGDLADGPPIPPSQQQICALEVKMDNVLLVEVVHALRNGRKQAHKKFSPAQLLVMLSMLA